jgi:proteasome beta subunit
VNPVEPDGELPGGAFMNASTSSFAEFLTDHAPALLPGKSGGQGLSLAHSTTIVALKFADGVIMAGDRRGTAGSMIAQRDANKVFRGDEYSAIGMAGVGSIGLELVRLFQVELEHYEKIEGRSLSLDGKVNRLATLIRGNLPLAMQGLVVVPLFAGYDENTGSGRIFSYDPLGGGNEEQRFHGIGSGSVFASGSLKKLYRENMPARDAVLACMQALYDAADEDSATGGPDPARDIYPVIATVTADGFQRLPESETRDYAREVIDGRLRAPDGPTAPLSPAP